MHFCTINITQWNWKRLKVDYLKPDGRSRGNNINIGVFTQPGHIADTLLSGNGYNSFDSAFLWRGASICLITTGSSMFAVILTAPPYASQIKCWYWTLAWGVVPLCPRVQVIAALCFAGVLSSVFLVLMLCAFHRHLFLYFLEDFRCLQFFTRLIL